MEHWRDVVGYEGYYKVSDHGRVISIPHKVLNGTTERMTRYRLLAQSIDGHGYYKVGLHKDGKMSSKKVHRLVAEAFIPNPGNLPFINHKDEVRTNNEVSNLEWCTCEYNYRYSALRRINDKRIRSRKICMEEVNDLIKRKKWTKLLDSVPLNKPTAVVCDEVRSLDSIKSVAFRINSRGDGDRKYSISTDYKQRLIIITATPRQDE